jgi:hypothetical protein
MWDNPDEKHNTFNGPEIVPLFQNPLITLAWWTPLLGTIRFSSP